jgi:hypothetical protein
MKKVFATLLLFMSVTLQGFAAAKYKPAFYDRAMAAIHTPMQGDVEQAPLPPVNLAAEVPTPYNAGGSWYQTPKEQRKASIGTGLLIAGAAVLITGLYLYFRYTKSEYNFDELDELGYSLAGTIMSAASTGFLVPGFILRMKYGGANRSHRRY